MHRPHFANPPPPPSRANVPQKAQCRRTALVGAAAPGAGADLDFAALAALLMGAAEVGAVGEAEAAAVARDTPWGARKPPASPFPNVDRPFSASALAAATWDRGVCHHKEQGVQKGGGARHDTRMHHQAFLFNCTRVHCPSSRHHSCPPPTPTQRHGHRATAACASMAVARG